MIHRELCSVWKYYYYVNVFKNILSAKFSSVESLFSLIWRIKRKSKFLRATKTQESLFRKRRKLNEDIDWSSRNNIHGSHVSR